MVTAVLRVQPVAVGGAQGVPGAPHPLKGAREAWGERTSAGLPGTVTQGTLLYFTSLEKVDKALDGGS